VLVPSFKGNGASRQPLPVYDTPHALELSKPHHKVRNSRSLSLMMIIQAAVLCALLPSSAQDGFMYMQCEFGS
jgi:hypothetical protein